MENFENRPSTIGNRKSARLESSIFLELTAYSRQPTVGGQLRSAVISLPIARCLLLSAFWPAAFCPFRSSNPDAGILPCGLRSLDVLGFEKVGDLRADMTAPHGNTWLLYQHAL